MIRHIRDWFRGFWREIKETFFGPIGEGDRGP